MSSRNVASSLPRSNSLHDRDTIAAVATAPGRAALAIVRISGPAVREIAARVLVPAKTPKPRYAGLAKIVDSHGALIDEGVAIFFAAPASSTGEDVLELHVHGSPIGVELTLAAVMAAGARLARPGEFTKRAFLAGKLDLSAAEAVADLIDAEHQSAARAAAGRLAGGVATIVQRQRHELQSYLEELAASIDFPDEVADMPRETLTAGLCKIRDAVAEIVAGGRVGRLVREGAAVAIIGPPNAGKSSLLNALLGDERALVSPIAGTTRDTIEETFDCDGIMLRLIDTAGLRDGQDEIERAGIDRSRRTLEAARLRLIVIDGSQPLNSIGRAVLDHTAGRLSAVFLNKADLGSRISIAEIGQDMPIISGSVYDTRSLLEIRQTLRALLLESPADLERPYLARAREIDAATEALAALHVALETLSESAPLDLISGDLVRALSALGKITGDTVTEEILTGIFARFCIGK